MRRPGPRPAGEAFTAAQIQQGTALCPPSHPRGRLALFSPGLFPGLQEPGNSTVLSADKGPGPLKSFLGTTQQGSPPRR